MSTDYVYMEPPAPMPDVTYPLSVLYCEVCSLPPEYCEYTPNYEQCKAWLFSNFPDEFNRLNLGTDMDGDTQKRQTRGGKGLLKKKKEVQPHITICTAARGKKKFVTVVNGLSTFEIDLKEASKYFGQKLATGCSVTGNADELVIQGDVKDRVNELLLERWTKIERKFVEDLGEQKR